MRLDLSSPHAWGCFWRKRGESSSKKVFPTRVGVFPRHPHRPTLRLCLPHTRGGVSLPRHLERKFALSSPHAWGCFSHRWQKSSSPHVFPTRVGVFPGRRWSPRSSRRLPHTRGGVSTLSISLPLTDKSSPHAWGCFPRRLAWVVRRRVFPTRVGVFLSRWISRRRRFCLPHTRGGVSFTADIPTDIKTSSPHAWGCFPLDCILREFDGVFPTRVGVFPRS